MLEKRIFSRFIQKKKKKICRSLKNYWRSSSKRKIYRKVTSGGIIEEKATPPMLFYGKNFSAICFKV
jgi:hypothetical protein